MQEKLAQNEQELKQLHKKRIDQLEPLIDDLTRQIENAKENLSRSKLEIKSLNEQIASWQKNEQIILKKIKEIVVDEAAQTKLEKHLEKCRSEYEKVENKASSIRAENEEIGKKIVEISKNILDGPKENKKELEKQIADTNSQILNANVEIKTAARNLANSKKKLNNFNEEYEQNAKNLEKLERRLGEIDEESKEVEEKYELAKIDCENLGKEIAEKSKSLKNLDTKSQKLENEKIDLTHKLEKLNEGLHNNEHDLKHYTHSRSNLKLHDIDKLENGYLTDENPIDDTVDDATKTVEALKTYDEETLEDADIDALKKVIHELDEKLKSHAPNLNAIQSFNELQKKFMDRVAELEEITQQRDQLCNNFDELRKQRLDEFMCGFTKIRLKLKEIYRTVTLDGDAELELVDSLDPFTEGIVLSVRPPKKSWKNVSNLSGGEKTLSSLSLVFALHEFRSTPIYVIK
jgi:structural maintenance of chromosome 4